MGHHHDLGLKHDLQTMIKRRSLLGLSAAGATAILAGCGGGSSTSSDGETGSGSGSGGSTGGGTGTSSCAATTPGETAGPYPADGSNSANGSIANVLQQSGVVRQDIRSSFGTLRRQGDIQFMTFQLRTICVVLV